jgi:hypothetical protein
MWWVVLIIFWWDFECVNSFALRDTHRFEVEKNEVEKKNSFRWLLPGSLIDLILGEERSQWKPKYGIKQAASIWIIRVKAVENLGEFKFISSLLAKRQMIGYFPKTMSGEFPLVLCADIEIYHMDGQTLCYFEAWRVLTTRAIAWSTMFLL